MADKPAAKPAAKPATKSVVYQSIAAATGLTRKQVTEVFDELTKLIKKDVSKKGVGVFTIAGLVKVSRVTKPATKARQGRNPQTGETITIKAKPARTVIKVRPHKSLKEMV